jgi:pimeloyl-ACP methyl ester carboxylesterase
VVNAAADAVTAGWSGLDVDANGVRLHVHRAGRPDRPPLVLAHGLSDSGRCWWRVAAELEDHLDLVMVDARHHGRSSNATGPSSTLAEDLGAVIDALDLERPALMGHSIGARTVAQFAASHPHAPARLVLIDPPWTTERETDGDLRAAEREAIRGWLGSFGDMTEAELAALGRQQHPDWPDDEFPTWIEAKRQVHDNAADDLGGIGWGTVVAALECPTLLVHGLTERGGIVTDEVAARVCELNERVTSACVDDAGHNIHRENLDAFLDVVRPFLLPDQT